MVVRICRHLGEVIFKSTHSSVFLLYDLCFYYAICVSIIRSVGFHYTICVSSIRSVFPLYDLCFYYAIYTFQNSPHPLLQWLPRRPPVGLDRQSPLRASEEPRYCWGTPMSNATIRAHVATAMPSIRGAERDGGRRCIAFVVVIQLWWG